MSCLPATPRATSRAKWPIPTPRSRLARATPATWSRSAISATKNGRRMEDGGAELGSRGDQYIGYNPGPRGEALKARTLPLKALPCGRKQTRTKRHLSAHPKKQALPLVACKHGDKCKNECSRVTEERRKQYREEYNKRRTNIKTGAWRSAMEFCWSNMTSVLYYPEKLRDTKVLLVNRNAPIANVTRWNCGTQRNRTPTANAIEIERASRGTPPSS